MTTSYDDAVATGVVTSGAGTGPKVLGTPVGQRRVPNMTTVYSGAPVVPTGGRGGNGPDYMGPRSPAQIAAGGDGYVGPRSPEQIARGAGAGTGSPEDAGAHATQRQDGWNTETVKSRYYQGDEYTLASTLPPEDRARMQQSMRDSGLIGKDTRLTWGEWDATSANAFQEVLTMANVNGMTWQEQMGRLDQVAAQHPQAATGSQRPALTIRQSSPEDLRQVFNDSAQKLLGRRATEDELGRMIAGYNSRETQDQTQTYSQTYSPDGKPGKGGTVVATPSAGAFAESTFEQQNPGELGGARIAQTFDSFQNILNRMGTL